MSERQENNMNLKLNNGIHGSQRLDNEKQSSASKTELSIKEERQRTGRYIAILVGICLFLLAMYHAWVRKIPIVASLVVPALIMFIYVAWVLYSAARDKHRLLMLDAEAALEAANAEAADNFPDDQSQNIEIAIISSKDNSRVQTPEGSLLNEWSEATFCKEDNAKTGIEHHFRMPIILINDKLPEDLDQKWIHVVEALTNSEKLVSFHRRTRYKRKFCRRKHTVFKRSYSIA